MKRKEVSNMITVDVGKLSTGLALTFKGVTAVFESLGADTVPGFGTASALEGEKPEEAPLETAEGKIARKSAKKDAKAADVAADDNAVDTANATETVADTAEDSEATVEAVETTEANNTEAKAETSSEEPEKADKAVEAGKPGKAAGGSPFTLNDIMKIAAQKMAKDAAVTEKIGALVKTYGVSTLKELPEEKFEAFMTDLTQI